LVARDHADRCSRLRDARRSQTRGGKFSGSFDAVPADAGIKIVLIGKRRVERSAPKNAQADSCLNLQRSNLISERYRVWSGAR
jgi:hypothetical protein